LFQPPDISGNPGMTLVFLDLWEMPTKEKKGSGNQKPYVQ
ncbi:hypothetical protein AVEN_142296-1, partial [Araneus ventricosus]